MDTPQILILGAGLMGRVAAYYYLHHGQGWYGVRLADNNPDALKAAAAWLDSPKIETTRIDVEDDEDLERALEGVRVCHSCVPYFMNPRIARMCVEKGISFVDLGGNPEVTDKILGMDAAAKEKGVVLIPDTGLAPGLGSILAWELVQRFQQCDEVHIRVGGLPQEPKGPLKYAQFFSIHGLLNEYLEDAREIRDGKEVIVKSLEEVESLSFGGIGELEAFITSGGTSTLTRTLLGKVRRLDYKTIRYPGHAQALQLLRDLGLTSSRSLIFGGEDVSPRMMLAQLLDEHLPKNARDIVLVLVTATGDGGREEQLKLVIRHDARKNISAMGQGTAYPSAAIVRAILIDKIAPGAHPQETVIPYEYMKDELRMYGVMIEDGK